MRGGTDPLEPPSLYTEIVESVTKQSVLGGPGRSDLLNQVVGAASLDGYLYGGLTAAAGIRAVLAGLASSIRDFPRVLDWGCGSGRVIRWFEDVSGSIELVGTDINDDAVIWCQKNLRFGSFLRNAFHPPLPFPDDYFDLIYGISVVTHLDEDFQRAWLTELDRIIRPGGLVLLTVHAEVSAEWDLSGPEIKAFRQHGFLYKRTRHPSLEGLPDFYQVAFHSRPYIERVWTKYFDIRAYLKHGPMYKQQMVVLQKPQRRRSFRREGESVIEHDLPLACWDVPAAGTIVAAPAKLDVAGWAFHPDGREVCLSVWVDGQRAARCPADQDRPDVQQVFSSSSSSRLSGFLTNVDVPKTEPGLHALWITTDDSPIPLCTTFFRVPELLGV